MEKGVSIKDGIDRVSRIQPATRIYRYGDSRTEENLYPGKKQAEEQSFYMLLTGYRQGNAGTDQPARSENYDRTAEEADSRGSSFDVKC